MSFDAQQEYNRQLRRLYRATKYLQSPEQLALIINKRLAKIEDGALIRNIVQTRFETAGTSGGFTWPQLAESTQDERKDLGYGPAAPILIRSGLLITAATSGDLSVNSDQITLTFKDGPAPHYIGRGRHKKLKINREAAAAIDQARATGATPPDVSSNRLSDYADALNAARPFYNKPTEGELAPLFEARNRIIAAAMSAIANGESLYDAIETTS